jgi:hypothetical protein
MYVRGAHIYFDFRRTKHSEYQNNKIILRSNVVNFRENSVSLHAQRDQCRRGEMTLIHYSGLLIKSQKYA